MANPDIDTGEVTAENEIEASATASTELEDKNSDLEKNNDKLILVSDKESVVGTTSKCEEDSSSGVELMDFGGDDGGKERGDEDDQGGQGQNVLPNGMVSNGVDEQGQQAQGGEQDTSSGLPQDKVETAGDAEATDAASQETPTMDDTSDSDSDISLSSEAPSEVSFSEASLNGTPAKRMKLHHEAGIKAIKHHQQLKKSKEPFVQHKFCEKIVRKYALVSCIECRLNKNPRPGRKGRDCICRFYHFRRLMYTGNGKSLTVAGFPDPQKDYSEFDEKLWKPVVPPEGMTFDLAKYLLEEVGDQFCELVKQEKATLLHIQNQDRDQRHIIWRKTVKDLRELCDVCSTTLFNYHWTCGKCGFVVCVSCFVARKSILEKDENTAPDSPSSDTEEEGRAGFKRWQRCHRNAEHDPKLLLLTQIITGNALDELSQKMHELRVKLKIPEGCGCTTVLSSNDVYPSLDEMNVNQNGASSLPKSGKEFKMGADAPDKEDKNQDAQQGEDNSDEENEQDGILDLFGGDDDEDECSEKEECEKKEGEPEESEPKAEASSNEMSTRPPPEHCAENQAGEMQLTNFVRKVPTSAYAIKVVPKRTLSAAESKSMYPNVAHTWLCRGNLLRLLEPTNPHNFKIFQDQWKRGQPVIVSNIDTHLNKDLWTPESFSKDFGHKTSFLINCMTGKVVPPQKMSRFWDGFEKVNQRLTDENGVKMLLKLKDWPPGDDFAEFSPSRFYDLMGALPLGEYTHRDGRLNLAARLPSFFSRPDLGPKMYIAYGSGLHLDKGTTNLHLDISDAVNVMVYVGVVKDVDTTEHTKAVMEAIEESDCDNSTINRAKVHGELPGALWHIWEAKDADKIRDMMNKISLERGHRVERHHDAIHDQSVYLDRDLRRRLMEEYNVIGYPIIQYAGDAVFIPAGAPHQVRNLNNCIKIAEDFVSPENVGHCFHLTEEFRNLSDTHSNHEDKLQIKNIVYHTVKDAVAVIEAQFAKKDSA